jgi:hypothetical protein
MRLRPPKCEGWVSETLDLNASSAAISTKVDNLQKTLTSLQQAPIADSTVVAIQEQLRRLDEETSKLTEQTSQLRQQAQANIAHVDFLVPRRREVTRGTLWVEVSGDRLWCIGSDDYTAVRIDSDSTQFSRRFDATGTSVSAIVSNSVEQPPEFLTVQPRKMVLEVALHPDGYQAFRKLRKWAWEKGYSVNWEPQEGDSITLVRTGHVYEQW